MLETNQSAAPLPNLYALLIGINNYRNHPLQGCINDVEQMRTYLASPFVQEQFGQVHLEELLNEQATKDQIVRLWQEHLGRAGKNDTVLFYFSGHGAREKTDFAILREEEMDGNIGGVLCAAFEGVDQADLYRHVLSNKEFRYLIRPLTMDENAAQKAHVVAIFDCCHSGSNTRSVLTEALPDNARQISRQALPGRALDQFVFGKDRDLLSRLKKQNQSLNEILPQGDHIMLAACREVELAWEREIGDNKQSGAFTTALVEVLHQHKGRISYHELHSRVLNRMKFSLSTSRGDRGQTPQVYVRTRDLNDRHKLFLSNLPHAQPTYGSVEYSESEREWRIDLGALNGILPDQSAGSTKVKVYPVKGKGKAITADIAKVFPFHSVLDFSPVDMPQQGRSYRGELKGVVIFSAGVFIKGEKEGKAAVRKALQEKLKRNGPRFKLVGRELDADYVVRVGHGVVSVTRPYDAARPVVKTIDYLDGKGQFNPQKITELYHVLQQVSRWSFLKELTHTQHELPAALIGKTTMYPVEFRLFRFHEEDGREERILPLDNRFVLQPDEPDRPVRVRIELVNHAPQVLNCTLAIMTGDFGFLVPQDKNIMRTPVVVLQEADQAQNAHIAKSAGWTPSPWQDQVKETYFGLKINPYFIDFNLPGEPNYFKLIVSSKPLDAIQTFHMERLGYPSRDRGQVRSDDWGDAYQLEDPKLPEVEWDVRTIEIYLTNPVYDPDRP